MGETINNSISYLTEYYPEMEIIKNEYGFDIKGRFIIQAYYKDIFLDIAPKLHIFLPLDYPHKIPIVYDLQNKYIIKDHLLDKGALCVATEFDLYLQLANSSSIEDYIDKFLIPYFISYKSYQKNKKYIYGDREHGVDGIYQSVGEYFNICFEVDNNDHKEIIRNLLRWSIRDEKFRFLFPDDKYRVYMINRYSGIIGEIRKIGILSLKKVFRSLERHESIKQYFEYQKSIRQSEI